jgi:hypothetical protein
VIVRLEDNSAWLWSPILWSEDLQREIEVSAGPIRHLVSPNKIHWLFLQGWKEQCPDARMYASPGLSERKAVADLSFDTTLTDTADPSYSLDIDQVILWGSMLPEVVFFHRKSRTLMVCDYIQRFDENNVKGWKGWLLRADGLVGPNGTAPGEVRIVSRLGGALPRLRLALDRIRLWQPDKIIIAHGANAESQIDAMQVMETGFGWIGDSGTNPIPSCWCCPTQVANTEKTD